VDAAQIGSIGLLLSLLHEEARQAFRGRLLDPLLAYDREHGTELVRTLEVFLRCSGSWTKAAEVMFVHVNSLRYRIRRIEELTGRDLSSLEDQAALLLALRLTGDQRAGPGGDDRGQAGEFPGSSESGPAAGRLCVGRAGHGRAELRHVVQQLPGVGRPRAV
jgi:hypothetical protein